MRLEAEIKDNKFIFSYQISSSCHNLSMEICTDTLVAFTNIIKICGQAVEANTEKKMRELIMKGNSQSSEK
jgi:hypothetical protein